MTETEITRKMLNNIRELSSMDDFKLINEAKDKNDAIAITDEPRFGQKALSNQISQFRSAVDGGAMFSNADKNNVASSPLIYLPSTKNLVFSGSIPSCGNLKFQLVLRSNTGYGAWVFIPDGMLLTDRTLEIINKIYQFYLNWRDEWESQYADLESMAQSING